MASPNPATDTIEWWNNLIDLHPPKDQIIAEIMDEVRNEFKIVGLFLIESLPPGPDLTVALRSLKDASQHAIAAIACNQDHYDGEDQA